MQFCAMSDKGMVRDNNEDYCIAKRIGNYTFFVLADGMGGHNGGEIASFTASQKIESFLSEKLTDKLIPAQISMFMEEAVTKANDDLLLLSKKDKALEGMGTTCEVCIISNKTAYIAHIGDSRVYKITKEGEITRLTRDHSLMEHMIEAGLISPEEAKTHPQKNIILQALGINEDIKIDLIREKLSDGDTLLLCSDGLSNMLDDETISKTIRTEKEPSKIAEKLIKLANDAGGTDNISVIVANEEV